MTHIIPIAEVKGSPFERQFVELLQVHRGHEIDLDSTIKECNDAHIVYFAEETGGVVISMLRVLPYRRKNPPLVEPSPKWYVNMVHTKLEYRRQGYSRRVFEHLFKNFAGSIVLEVDKHNEAKKLYQSLGFQKVMMRIFKDQEGKEHKGTSLLYEST